MEKKIMNKKFLLLSSLNLIPAVILGGGLTYDSLALVLFLMVLVLNHITLVKLVQTLSTSMTGSENGSPVVRILFLLFLKTLLIGAALAGIYFYNPDLLPKVFGIMIFQLIIQVLSIKNNDQN